MDLAKDSVNTPEWDYTRHAEYYQYRPNYSPEAIDNMLKVANFSRNSGFLAADVGAGTGNLTTMLLEKSITTIAIEPNAGMRRIGIELTEGHDVVWQVGTGERTGLTNDSIDLYAMGSSFNTTERSETLAEAKRVLKPAGWFACMWNHRNLEDPHQIIAENIIQRHIPDYMRGTRREDQSDILKSAAGFENLKYIENSKLHKQTLENYILAWKSVKNRFWDLSTAKGEALFDNICESFRSELPSEMHLTYTTRIWMIQKK